MTAADVVRTGALGLRTRRARAALSALGIAIGVASMVAVLGISQSSKADLLAQLDRLGTNLLTAAPGQTLGGDTATLPSTATQALSRLGGVRDVAHSRAIGYPIWASDITPVTGKWRLETVEINGEIQMDDVRVNAGDLVIADDTGVVFVPRADIMRVLELCEKKKGGEDKRIGAITEGVPMPVFYNKG